MTSSAAPARPFAPPMQWATADVDRGRLGEGSPDLHRARSPRRELVAFLSEGATLHGWLYSHAERTDPEPQRRPALVLTHGFTPVTPAGHETVVVGQVLRDLARPGTARQSPWS